MSETEHQNQLVIQVADGDGARLAGVTIKASIEDKSIGKVVTDSGGRAQFTYDGAPAPVKVTISYKGHKETKILAAGQNLWTFNINKPGGAKLKEGVQNMTKFLLAIAALLIVAVLAILIYINQGGGNKGESAIEDAVRAASIICLRDSSTTNSSQVEAKTSAELVELLGAGRLDRSEINRSVDLAISEASLLREREAVRTCMQNNVYRLLGQDDAIQVVDDIEEGNEGAETSSVSPQTRSSTPSTDAAAGEVLAQTEVQSSSPQAQESYPSTAALQTSTDDTGDGPTTVPERTNILKGTAYRGGTSLRGSESFDYSTYSGDINVGSGARGFTLDFSGCRSDCIQLYSDPAGISRVALVRDIQNQSSINFNDIVGSAPRRKIDVYEGQAAIIENVNGYYVLIIPTRIEYDGQDGSSQDLIEFVYTINSQKDPVFRLN